MSSASSGASSAKYSVKRFVREFADELGMQRDLLKAERYDMLGLIGDVIRIETGEIPGEWKLKDGRLWVMPYEVLVIT